MCLVNQIMLTPSESQCEDFPVSCLRVVLQTHDRPLAWWKIDYCLGYQTVIWPHFHFSFSSAAESYAFIKMGVICSEIHEVRLHTCQTFFFSGIDKNINIKLYLSSLEIEMSRWKNGGIKIKDKGLEWLIHSTNIFWMHLVHTANR